MAPPDFPTALLWPHIPYLYYPWVPPCPTTGSYGPAVQHNGWEKGFLPSCRYDIQYSEGRHFDISWDGMAALRINPFFPWSHWDNKGPFINYVGKMRGRRGPKNVCFCSHMNTQEGIKKLQTPVHVVVECAPARGPSLYYILNT